MLSATQFNTLKAVQIIERDINTGRIKTVRQLLSRTTTLPYSAYCKLLQKVRAKR